ncbi:MAG TPA: murein L,D-transpeptidase catalytic domain family protein [Vicinamibacterales bacterium]|jgi:hypothetical protein
MIRNTAVSALLLAVVFANSTQLRAANVVRPAAHDLVERLSKVAGAPSPAALTAALAAYDRAIARGAVSNPRYLTVIDYSLPSIVRRLWILDLSDSSIVLRDLVAHGRGSGENMATSFSNDDGSKMSSLGLFVTDAAYIGSHGYSLRLRGLDPGLNDHAYDRAIVVHGAPYVSEAAARSGRLGRSWGCAAVRTDIARTVIDTIKDGTVLFAYAPHA